MYVVVGAQSLFRTRASWSLMRRRTRPSCPIRRLAPARRLTWLASCFKSRPRSIWCTFYRGAAPALQDVLAGQADYVMDLGISFPHVKAGKARMLAVAGAKRSSFFRGAGGSGARHQGRRSSTSGSACGHPTARRPMSARAWPPRSARRPSWPRSRPATRRLAPSRVAWTTPSSGNLLVSEGKRSRP